MKMNDTVIKRINDTYTGNYHSYMRLNVGSSLRDTSVYKDNWEICRLGELSTLIEELTWMRDAIESETGCKF